MHILDSSSLVIRVFTLPRIFLYNKCENLLEKLACLLREDVPITEPSGSSSIEVMFECFLWKMTTSPRG